MVDYGVMGGSLGWSCHSVFHGWVFSKCYDRTVSGEENGGEMSSLEDNNHKQYHARTYRSFLVVDKVQTVPCCVDVYSSEFVSGGRTFVSGEWIGT